MMELRNPWHSGQLPLTRYCVALLFNHQLDIGANLRLILELLEFYELLDD